MISYELAARHAPQIAFAVVFVASLGAPVPAFATLVLVGASLSITGPSPSWQVWPMLGGVLLAAIAGGLAGDLVWFTCGRRYGHRTLHALCKLTMSRDSCVIQTEKLYGRWGAWVLVMSRFIPGLSLVAVPLAGAMKVRVAAFLWRDAAGTFVWAAVALGAGPYLAPVLKAASSALATAGPGALVAAIVLAAAFVAYRHVRRTALIRRLGTHRISVEDLRALMSGDATPTVIDVRSVDGRQADPYAIVGAVLGSDAMLQDAALAARQVVLYCASPNDVAAATLAEGLRARGVRTAVTLTGGLAAWRKAGLALVPLDRKESTAPLSKLSEDPD
ncbi:MAG: VTT domain-containing protein [Pseudomonadota bacterium]|nr:VTT domain-containing protein [Pseudomonadota bacterium]